MSATKVSATAAVRARAVAHASEAFARHVVRPEGEGRWYFGRPGTGTYHFRASPRPGASSWEAIRASRSRA